MRFGPEPPPRFVSTTPCSLEKEAKTRIVKVSSTTVAQVRKVLSGRLRMPAMPMRIAERVVLDSLATPCTVEERPWSLRISSLILPIMMAVVMMPSMMMTKARKMTIGAEAREKAGCVT